MKKYILKEKFLFSSTIIFIVIKTILNIALALVLQEVMDVATEGNIGKLKYAVMWFVIIAVVEPISCYLKDLFQSNYIKRILVKLKNDLFIKVLKRDIRKFNEENTGNYISTITNDVNIIEKDYFETIFAIIGNILSFILGTMALISINIYITIAIFIISIVMLVIPFAFGNILSRKKKVYSDSNGVFITKIKDIFSGFEVIKSFNIEKRTVDDFKKSNNEVEASKRSFFMTNSLADNIADVVGSLMFVVSLGLGAYFVIKGKMSIGQALAAMQLVNNIVFPMQGISSYINKIKATKLIRDKFSAILNEKETLKETGVKSNLEKGINFNSVVFSYDGEKNIVNGVSTIFEKGKKYAIVGQSGCGKSTILKLLLGYYETYKGDIKIDDIDIKDISSTDLTNLISIIHQNVFIFDDDIKNNITLFNDYSKEKIDKIIKFVKLEYLLNEKNKTSGENGCYLSGGEKQRIAIARALIKESPIVILDEATSALDNQTAYEIETSLLKLKELTSIVITHKLNKDILKNYDKILVMKDGKIKEEGTFEYLIEKRELFYSLYTVTSN